MDIHVWNHRIHLIHTYPCAVVRQLVNDQPAYNSLVVAMHLVEFFSFGSNLIHLLVVQNLTIKYSLPSFMKPLVGILDQTVLHITERQVQQSSSCRIRIFSLVSIRNRYNDPYQ